MSLPRLVIAAAALLALAACDNSPRPPAQQASAPAATATTTPKAPAAAAPAAQTAAASDATAPLMGSWSTDLSKCSSTAISISPASFAAGGGSCDITKLTDNRDGTFTAALSCNGKAENVAMRPLFAPTGEGIELTYLNRKNQKQTVLRCVSPAAAQ